MQKMEEMFEQKLQKL